MCVCVCVCLCLSHVYNCKCIKMESKGAYRMIFSTDINSQENDDTVACCCCVIPKRRLFDRNITLLRHRGKLKREI